MVRGTGKPVSIKNIFAMCSRPSLCSDLAGTSPSLLTHWRNCYNPIFSLAFGSPPNSSMIINYWGFFFFKLINLSNSSWVSTIYQRYKRYEGYEVHVCLKLFTFFFLTLLMRVRRLYIKVWSLFSLLLCHRKIASTELLVLLSQCPIIKLRHNTMKICIIERLLRLLFIRLYIT